MRPPILSFLLIDLSRKEQYVRVCLTHIGYAVKLAILCTALPGCVAQHFKESVEELHAQYVAASEPLPRSSQQPSDVAVTRRKPRLRPMQTLHLSSCPRSPPRSWRAIRFTWPPSRATLGDEFSRASISSGVPPTPRSWRSNQRDDSPHAGTGVSLSPRRRAEPERRRPCRRG